MMPAADPILRVQDREGRGPWRPGLAARWSFAETAQILPASWEEIPDLHIRVERAAQRGLLHVGCAVRGTEGLRLWFNRGELQRLRDLGFSVVRCTDVEVIAETPHQLVIGRRAELRSLPPLAWRRVWTMFADPAEMEGME
jgi:hypothetical protein